MNEAYGPVWVVGEQIDGAILPVSLQLSGHARKLADELGVYLEVILLGESLNGQIEQLIAAGADRIYLCESPEFGSYQSEIYCEIIAQLAIDKQPEILLLGSTSMGRELAPLVAARLKTGLTAHCIDLVLNEKKILEQHVPAYGVILSVICPKKRPQMATVAQGVFPNPELDERRRGEIVALYIPQELNQRVQTIEVFREVPKGMTLETASIVVAGGAGAIDLQGWQFIVDLAEVLNAALGSTRPVVDEGWTEPETMIGQSGKMVSPELYIGVGLSGELQHMVGIVDPQIMVAINNDPKAPIFEWVDYGIVEDCREFVPLLLEKLAEYKAAKTKQQM
jgi:electron transfer flavoprotein alpha subunit